MDGGPRWLERQASQGRSLQRQNERQNSQGTGQQRPKSQQTLCESELSQFGPPLRLLSPSPGSRLSEEAFENAWQTVFQGSHPAQRPTQSQPVRGSVVSCTSDPSDQGSFLHSWSIDSRAKARHDGVVVHAPVHGRESSGAGSNDQAKLPYAAPQGQSGFFGLSELTKRTGATKATVQHYLRLGLMPLPVAVGPRRFLYDSRHVRALELVKDLQTSQGWSLREISEAFKSLPGGLDSLLMEDPSEVVHIGQHPRVALATLCEQRAKCSPRARLLEAGIAAFSRRGSARVHVDEIAEMAGMAKGSFYLHFDSKEELFRQAALEVAKDVAAKLRGSTKVRGTSSRASRRDASDAIAQALGERAPLLLELLALAAAGRPQEKETAAQVLAEISSACSDVFSAASRHGEDMLHCLGSALLSATGVLQASHARPTLSANVAS